MIAEIKGWATYAAVLSAIGYTGWNEPLRYKLMSKTCDFRGRDRPVASASPTDTPAGLRTLATSGVSAGPRSLSNSQRSRNLFGQLRSAGIGLSH